MKMLENVTKKDIAKAFAPLGVVIIFAIGLGLHIGRQISR